TRFRDKILLQTNPTTTYQAANDVQDDTGKQEKNDATNEDNSAKQALFKALL
ncbi:18411_t:CDS:2, partial [Dentiscutata erythropus]